MSENPYQAPQIISASSFTEEIGSPHEIRRAHIQHEASVKSIGTLYYLGAFALTIWSFAAILTLVNTIITGPADVATWGAMSAVPIVLVPLTILQWFAAYGIKKLKPWGRIVGVILSAIGLLGFPIGTIISAYMLYLLLSKKGGTVFSPGYKEIIAATPDVKYKTSLIVWIVLGVFLLIIVAAIVSAFLLPHR